jgi:hypothetical protein
MIKLQFMFHLNSNPERIWGCIIKIDNLKLAQHCSAGDPYYRFKNLMGQMESGLALLHD